MLGVFFFAGDVAGNVRTTHWRCLLGLSLFVDEYDEGSVMMASLISIPVAVISFMTDQLTETNSCSQKVGSVCVGFTFGTFASGPNHERHRPLSPDGNGLVNIRSNESYP